MEPIMQLINTLNALNAAMQKLTEKMTSEYISTFEEICTGSEPQKEPEPVKEEKPVDRPEVRAKPVLDFQTKLRHCFRSMGRKGYQRSMMRNFLH